MKKLLLLLGIILFNNANAQLIVNNTTQSPAQLVQNVLLGAGISVSNVTFNGSAVNANVIRDQVGHFQNGSSTNIGIDSGVILATGKAQLAIGPNTGSSTDATANPLTGDSDLAQLTTNTVRNKAILEFDFVPLGQNLSFNFVFASEEYPNFANSAFNDVFGFFLSGPGLSGPYTGGAVNIALIPSSGGTPITINNLNNGTTNNGPCEYCTYYVNNTNAGQNPNTGASTIQYNGFTTVLAALSNVQCGMTYHIKLAIANVGDNSLDSAVFLQANSFNTDPLDFGNDYLVSNGFAPCDGTSIPICTGLGASVPHEWTLDGNPIAGTGPCISVNQPGEYCVTAYPYGPACPISDCIIIEYLPPMPVNPPIALFQCPGAPFDLSLNTPIVLGSYVPDTITYYASLADAQNFNNEIVGTNLTSFTPTATLPQEIWVRVDDNTSCISIQSFFIDEQSCVVPDLVLCDDSSNNQIENFDLTPQTAIALGSNPAANYTVTYHYSQADADSGNNPISPITSVPNTLSNPQTIYIRVEQNANPAIYTTTTFQLIVNPSLTPTFSPIPPICSGDTLNPLPTTSNNSIVGSWTPALNNTATTTYTFTPNTGQCASTTTLTIAVNPLPNGTVTGGTSVLQNSGPSTSITFTGSNGTAPYTFTYNINGAIPNQTISTTVGNSVSLSLPSTTAGTYNVNLVSVEDANTPSCSRSLTQTATLVVVPIPSATITGSTTVCQNNPSPNITFTGLNGTPPYVFTYNINGVGSNQVTPPSVGNSYLLSVPTNVVGTYNYNLVSVQDANSTQPQSGTATVNVISAPTITAPTPYQVCDDNNDGLSCLFFLHTKDVEIAAPGLTVEYYETATGAQLGGAANVITQNPYCNIVNTGPQTLYIRVYDPAAPSCFSLTTLQLIVNPRPVANPLVSNYELCDVTAPAGDGIEVFTLHTKDVEIANGLSLANYTINYYLTQAEAIAYTTSTALPNLYASATQTIWFNISNNTTGCNSVGSLNLVVNPLPQIVAPSPMYGCSNGVVMTASFNLNLNNASISAGAPGMTVTYYLTQLEAQTENNPLAIPYTSGNATIWVRVENNTTGCFDTTSLQLIVTQGPVANNPTPLHYCDPNNDGFGVFDLTAAIPQIVGATPTPAGVSVSFHETQTDSEIGANPLTSPYSNIDEWSQIIFVRVYYTLTNCANYVQLKLNVNPTPVATDPADYHVCDDNYDGFALFDLSSVDSQVLAALDPTTHAVTYHTSLSDAQTDANAITNVTNYQNFPANNQTIWVRVEILATGCYDIVELELIVDPLPQATQPAYPPYSLCDTSAPLGYEQFDLQSQVTSILLGQTGMSVTFYPSLAEANSQINAITNTTAYVNASPFVQTLGVVITNSATNCYVVSTMDIRVEPLPTPIPPLTPYTVCDVDQNGIAQFDLCTLTAAINLGGYIITYHETLTDAQSGNNDLACIYQNIFPFSQIIWVRAEDTLTGCFSTMPVKLQVDPSPVLPTTIPTLSLCDQDSNNQDGITLVNLELQTPAILGSQSTPGSNYTVTYYTSQANANAGLGSNIVGSTSYMGTDAQVIWVRIEHNTTGCFTIGSFLLEINIPLLLTSPTPLSVCDNDANPNDLHTTFNLTVKNGEITNNLPGYIVTYYPSYTDALNNTNVINNPTAYVNIPPAVQTLGVKVTSAEGCSSYTSLDIRVLPIPTPNTTPPTLAAQCENALDSGQQTFDITVNAAYIANGDPNVTLHYFHSFSDATSVPPVNEILNPTAALIGNPALLAGPTRPLNLIQNVYVLVTSNLFIDYNNQNCYAVVAQPFIINPLPLVVAIGAQQICEADPAGVNDGFEVFDLTSYTAALIAGNATSPASNYTVAFFTDAALTNQILNPSTYTNVTNPQVIYAQVTNTTTGCSNSAPFDIVVNPKPDLAAPLDFARCDDELNDNDGYYLYPLDGLTTGILNGQSATDYTVSYYNTSQADADAGINAIATSDLSNYQAQTQTIWIRVENNLTGCYQIGSFDIIIEQYATPVIETDNGIDSICVNFITQAVERSLTLFAINTTTYLNTVMVPQPNYTYQWYVDGVAIPGAIAPGYTIDTPLANNTSAVYTVEMTSDSALGCPFTSEQSFTVYQSGPAVPLAGTIGYTVTEAFSDNQIITVNVDGWGAGSYQYSLDDGPRQDSPVFENVSLGSHLITVWDTEGSATSPCDALVLQLIQTINYPHYFTPNGDGIHDTWNIVGLEGQPNTKIYIFDRFGKLIKQISSTGQGWDGTYNGQPLPSTDYWFTVDYNEQDTIKQFKAHFTLKR